MAALIPDSWKGAQFREIDLFVLSAAAALHDVGKAGNFPGDHGHVSQAEVEKRAMVFGLDQGQAEMVGWIVRSHNDGDLTMLPRSVPRGTDEVNVQLLAALFKLADMLHTDYRRVSLQVVGLGDGKAKKSPKTRFRLSVRGWIFEEWLRENGGISEEDF